MTRKLAAAPLVLLLAAALLAGCGSSSSSSGTSSATSSTPTATTGTGKLSAGAVARCKHGVDVLPTLSQAAKSRLEAICDKAASGDAGAARSAAREACEEIVKDSPLPAGTARDHALAGCKDAEKK
jgi:hypothetical protein